MARYPTSRADRIAQDIARQKNAEFLAKRKAAAQVLTDAEMAHLLREAWKHPDVAARPMATARSIEAAVLAKLAAP